MQKEAGGEGASESALISARAFTPQDGAKSPSSITIPAGRADMQDDVRLCLPFQVKSLSLRAIDGNDAPRHCVQLRESSPIPFDRRRSEGASSASASRTFGTSLKVNDHVLPRGTPTITSVPA